MATPHFLLAPSVLCLEEFYKTPYLIGMVLVNVPNTILQLISQVRESIMFKMRHLSSEDIRPRGNPSVSEVKDGVIYNLVN